MMKMELFKRIKMRREELGMSQEELAKLLGYKSRSTIAKIEVGENDLTQSKIAAFAKALKTTPGDLMGWNNEDSSTSDISSLPPLTPKDEREIAKDLEAMLNSLDNKNGMAAYNDPEDEEDRELLKASLLTSMRLAKQIAKKKFTPKKYRKE
ncbi:MAG: helix-turn-helix domain-containing protein [Bacillota bacterium]|jgi:transcriptional regulator with XRE-family HTH domain